jgi:hypothetical protein
MMEEPQHVDWLAELIDVECPDSKRGVLAIVVSNNWIIKLMTGEPLGIIRGIMADRAMGTP